MCRLSMRAILLSSILLLLRIIVPVVHGQPEWNNARLEGPFREPSAVDKGSNPVKTNEDGVEWSDSSQGQGASFNRDLSEPSPNLGTGYEHQQAANLDKYLLSKYPQKILANRMLGLSTFKRLAAAQQQKSNMQRQSGFLANNPAIDYPSDDIAQQLQFQLQPGYYPYGESNYIPSVSSVKARVMPKEIATLPRYFFSSFKRARDGYLCHFKLCQVGVSGKRLSSSM